MKTLKVLLVIAFAAIVTVASVSSGFAAGAPKKGGTLRVAFSDWPKNLHSQIDSGTEGLYVQVNITEGLVNIDQDGKIVPGLATALPDRPDDVTYIFKLRQGVKFHNGDDFTADDVLWTFDRLLGKFEGQASTQAPRFQLAIKSVEALDKYTVKFVLNKPWDDFVPMMAADKYMDILNKRAVLEMGADYGQKGAIGTGPFKFKEWIKEDHITIVRNDNYWGPAPYLDAITFRAIPEVSTRLIALKTGDVDYLLHPSWKDIQTFAKDPQFEVHQCDSGTEIPFMLNTSRPPLNDKKVRQAVFYGIDRQAIMDAVYFGYAAKGQGIFPAWHWAFDPKADLYAYSPDKAKQLLAEAGYNDANPLKFEIATGSATEYVDVSTLIQAQMAKIGAKVTVNAMEAAAWTSKTWPVDGKANPGYQAAVYRFRFSNLTTDFSWRIYHSKTSLNQTGYNQTGGYQRPEMDKLLDDAWGISDPEKATQAYRGISNLIWDDALVLILGWPKTVTITRSNVGGIGCFVREDTPLQGAWLN